MSTKSISEIKYSFAEPALRINTLTLCFLPGSPQIQPASTLLKPERRTT